MDHYVNKLN